MDDHRTQWSREATVPLLGGIIWLGSGLQAGWLALAISLLPGSLLMTAGVANLSWPGDARTRNLGAAAAIAGISTVPLLLFFVDPLVATGQIALCIAAAAALGRLALRSRTRAEGVPDAPLGFRASLESALDSAVLGGAILVAPPRGLHRSPVEAREEVEAARDLYRSRGWLEQPLTYHRNPPPLGKVELSPLRVSGFDVQHLRFESGYEPHLHEPGRDRYLGYAPCRTGHAWVLEHRGADRPWLICTHGYLMGGARLGLRAFPTAWLHRRLGLNLLLPVLPMHAQRKIHWMSGDGMLAANPLDTVHALAQTGWRSQADRAVDPLGICPISAHQHAGERFAQTDPRCSLLRRLQQWRAKQHDTQVGIATDHLTSRAHRMVNALPESITGVRYRCGADLGAAQKIAGEHAVTSPVQTHVPRLERLELAATRPLIGVAQAL
jgi:hypothetical protein